MSRATTDFQLWQEEEDGDDERLSMAVDKEEYEAWLDSLPTSTNVSGNCDEMFNREIIGDDTAIYSATVGKWELPNVAGNVLNEAFWAYQARVYSALSAEDLAFLITHIRQDEAYKCAELCEDIREQVAVSVDEHSAKAAALCSMAIRTKRMGTLTQDEA